MIRCAANSPIMTHGAFVSADVIVGMGCGDVPPATPDCRFEEWAVADPSGKDLPEVRAIRDEIERRVRWLLDDLRIPIRR